MAPSYTYSATITNIHDGDTVSALVDLGFDVLTHVHLRLYGINAPELNTDAGKSAKAYLQQLLGWPTVPLGAVVKTFKNPGDKYGRWLAILEWEGQNINDLMVESGHAVVYP